MDRGGIGGVETAEKHWVMVGWDGSVVLRVRLRDGGGWRRLRAAGRGERGPWLEMRQQGGEEWDPEGLGCSIHPSARLSRCVPGELGSWGQGLQLGHRHRWSRGCIHEEDGGIDR